MLKIGKLGSEVDNWHSSYLCGITQEGKLINRAFDNHLNFVSHTDNGILLDGVLLPNFKEMLTVVESLHKKYFPNCGTIGWDVLIDSAENVRIIEANITTPGVVAEQLASGDFFKDFRDNIVSSYNLFYQLLE